MRILVTGATGFIGAHVAAGLADAGHAVVGGARDAARARGQFPQFDWIGCDFNKDVSVDAWRPRLAGIDAVVNCAGILQGARGQSIDAIHRAAPAALFDACVAAGVSRVIQISALGVDPAAGTAYADSKRAADEHLAGLDLDWVVLRPSLVYANGSHGGTSLIRGLAGLPWVIPLPGGGTQAFQPLHLDDLARAICALVAPDAPSRRVIEAPGPERMTLREIVLELRQWLGLRPANVVGFPMGLMRAAARVGDVLAWISGGGPLTTTTIRQMTHMPIVDDQPFRDTIGFTPRRLADALARTPSQVQDRWHARLYFARPVLGLALVFWIINSWLGSDTPKSVLPVLVAAAWVWLIMSRRR
jgi:uncharacterized protein YbjT (DUF2867 family)